MANARHEQGRRPANIVFIQSDQHRYDCVGANGHPLLQTPNLDRLAAEGANFSHAFCPIPLCVPCRASLLTGQWPSRHLCIANFDSEAPRPLREDVPVFSRLLNEAGYYLAYIAKWHVHKEKTPVDFGFHEYLSEEQYHRWREDECGLPRIKNTNAWFGNVDEDIDPEHSKLAWGATQLIQKLQDCAKSRQPFFLRWDPTEPHLPNIPPEPYASMYAPNEIPPWPGFGDSLESKPYIQKQQQRTWKVNGWTWKDWAPIVGRYLGDISLLDAQVGRIMTALEELGLADDTILIYTSDHGDMCGSHGMLDKHYIMYDDVVRVPLMIRWPARIQPGQTPDLFTPHAIDLAATICDAAHIPIPETFQGTSLLPVLTGNALPDRQDIFSVYHGNQFGLYSQRMVRDRRWKYVWNATAEDELYDLDSDPGELQNRAADPDCRDQLNRLKKRTVEWMEETGDLLLNAWTRNQLLGQGTS